MYTFKPATDRIRHERQLIRDRLEDAPDGTGRTGRHPAGFV